MLRIQYELDRAGMTQEQLGEIVGCHRVVIGRYVRGQEKPRKERAEKIAAALSWSDDVHKLFEEVEVK